MPRVSARRLAVPLVALIAAGALIGLLVYGMVAGSANTSLDAAVRSGERPEAPAQDLRLPVLGRDGRSLSLGDLRGEVVVVNFWASWCEPCEKEAPALERAHARLTGSGAGRVLGVTYRDTTADSRAFVREHGLSYASVRDVDAKLGNAYGTHSLPETFVVDREGRIAAIGRGQVDDRFLREALDKAGA